MLNPVIARLTEFISLSFLDQEASGLDSETPLLELNILDSASLFDVVDFVRKEWRVHIPASEIHPGNFASIASLDQLIHRLLNQEATQ